MHDLKILALTSYGRLAASSRLRMMQFEKPLREEGIEVEFSNWLSDEILAQHYASGSPYHLSEIAGPSFKRLSRMWSAHKYDAVWLQKEAFSYLPWLLESIGWMNLPPVVVDYDDAVFHNYDLNRSPMLRLLLGRKIDHVMKASSAVIAGNAYLARRAERAGARDVRVIPTVVDTARYAPSTPKRGSRFRIGWIGSKTTVKYLTLVAPVLARAERELDAEIVIIGPGKVTLPGITPTNIKWTEKTEVSELSKLSVGIMPLTDTPWERGKCGYKLVQYMASGLPAIASPVGANVDIIADGKTGFLPVSNDDWFACLKQLKENPKLAATLGKAGSASVQKHYSVTAVLPQLVDTFRIVAS